nr:MAG TPA: phosphoadenosine-phosphosulfate reductase [Caudoviricetes sp.]
MPDIKELKYMQSLPLERKIEMTAERIDAWYQHYDGNVAVSFSGGKDSTVLLDIARNHWRGHKDIKAVFVDTGLEYPEIRQFVKTFDNVDIIRPAMRFDEVIKKYGYPVISKEVCESLYQAKKYLDSGGKKETYRLKKLRGKLKDKNDNISLFNQQKYEPLLYVNFYCSNICCNVMKKKPSHIYTKKIIVVL